MLIFSFFYLQAYGTKILLDKLESIIVYRVVKKKLKYFKFDRQFTFIFMEGIYEVVKFYI